MKHTSTNCVLEEFTIEQKWIHHLLLHSNIIDDIGLFRGKMGLTIFFAHFHMHTGNILFEDIADELMQDVINGIHVNLPINIENGLAGIGWGIEYLIQKGFLNQDSQEICEDLDKKIMEYDPRRIIDYSFEKGLTGLLHYVLAHIKGVYTQTGNIPFDKFYLHDLYRAIMNIPKNKINKERNSIIIEFEDFIVKNSLPKYEINLINFIQKEDYKLSSQNSYTPSLALYDGLAGQIFKSIL